MPATRTFAPRRGRPPRSASFDPGAVALAEQLRFRARLSERDAADRALEARRLRAAAREIDGRSR